MLLIRLHFLCVPKECYLIIKYMFYFFKNVKFIFHMLNNIKFNKGNVCAFASFILRILTYCDLERSIQKTHKIISRIK